MTISRTTIALTIMSGKLPEKAQGYADRVSQWITSRRPTQALFTSLVAGEDKDFLELQQFETPNVQTETVMKTSAKKHALLVIAVDRSFLLVHLTLPSGQPRVSSIQSRDMPWVREKKTLMRRSRCCHEFASTFNERSQALANII